MPTQEQTEDSAFAAPPTEELFDEHVSFGDHQYQEDQEEPDEPWYEVLGVSSNATPDEIKSAYRRESSSIILTRFQVWGKS